MRSPFLLALGFGLVVAAGASWADDKAPPPKDSYVKVRVETEVRGLLRKTDKGFAVASRFKVYELYNPLKELPESGGEQRVDVYDLDFTRAKELRELAEALTGKEVIVVGMSELRMVDQLRRPGGGSGLGPNPFPVPTWSLQNTVLVTGLKSAGGK